MEEEVKGEEREKQEAKEEKELQVETKEGQTE